MSCKFLFLGLLILISCNRNMKVENIIIYGSPEYMAKQDDDFVIKTEEAAEIFSKKYFEINPNQDSVKCRLDILINDYYVFPTSVARYNSKTGDYLLDGIWVNGKTGEVFNEDSGKTIKVHLEIPFSNYNKIFFNTF